MAAGFTKPLHPRPQRADVVGAVLHVEEDEVDIVVCRESNRIRARIHRDAEGHLVLVEQPDEGRPGASPPGSAVRARRARALPQWPRPRNECKPRENGSHGLSLGCSGRPATTPDSSSGCNWKPKAQLRQCDYRAHLVRVGARRPIRFRSTTDCRKSSRLGDCRATPRSVRAAAAPRVRGGLFVRCPRRSGVFDRVSARRRGSNGSSAVAAGCSPARRCVPASWRALSRTV